MNHFKFTRQFFVVVSFVVFLVVFAATAITLGILGGGVGQNSAQENNDTVNNLTGDASIKNAKNVQDIVKTQMNSDKSAIESDFETSRDARTYADPNVVAQLDRLEYNVDDMTINEVNNTPVHLIVLLAGDGAEESTPAPDGTEATTAQIDNARKNVENSQGNAQSQAEQITGNKVSRSYGYLLNGFAIEGTFNQIKDLEAIDGVEHVTIAATYTPADMDANQMAGVENVWREHALKGEGITVGVIDSGIDFSHPDLRLTDNNSAQFSQAQIQSAIQKFGYGIYQSPKVVFSHNYPDRTDNPGDQMDTYVDPQEGDVNVQHGQHVAGIIAANGLAAANEWNNSQDAEATVMTDSVLGAAPEAQLMNFKVFSNYGPSGFSDDIVAAIEDATALNVDVINMSLGSRNSTPTKWDPEQVALDKAAKKGIIPVASAGNSGLGSSPDSSGLQNSFYETTEDATVGSPSVASHALSVASANNTFPVLPTTVVGYTNDSGTTVPNFIPTLAAMVNDGVVWDKDSSHYNGITYEKVNPEECGYNKPILNCFPAKAPVVVLPNNHGGNDPYIPSDLPDFPGYGFPEDFNSCDPDGSHSDYYRGKVVIIGRGFQTDVPYEDKEKAAYNCHAIGVILVSNLPGEGTPVNFGIAQPVPIPVVAVSYDQGLALTRQVNDQTTSYTTDFQYTFTDFVKKSYDNGLTGTMSIFTSWGPTPDLQIKPEISGIGGGVWSLTNWSDPRHYQNMSGTSMSSPFVAGTEALLVQKLKASGKFVDGTFSFANAAKALVMNTAEPLIDEKNHTDIGGNIPFPVSRQGSGLVQIDKAIENNVMLTNADKSKAGSAQNDIDETSRIDQAKFELGIINTNTPEFNVKLDNFGTDNITYTFSDFGGIYEITRTDSGIKYHGDKTYPRITEQNVLIPSHNDSHVFYVENGHLAGSMITIDGATVSGNDITVPAGQTITFRVTLSIPSGTLDGLVDGFIRLEPKTGASPANTPAIGAPFLGYFGDFTNAQPLIDPPAYCQGWDTQDYMGNPNNIIYNKAMYAGVNPIYQSDAYKAFCVSGVTIPAGVDVSKWRETFNGQTDLTMSTSLPYGVYSAYEKGEGQAFSKVYGVDPELIAISPKKISPAPDAQGDDLFDPFYDKPVFVDLGVRRSIDKIKIDVVDEGKTNVLRTLYTDHDIPGNNVYKNATWDGTYFVNGRQTVAPDGMYYVRVTANPMVDGSNDQVTYYPITIDTTAPTFENVNIEWSGNEDESVHVTGQIRDKGVGFDRGYSAGVAEYVNGMPDIARFRNDYVANPIFHSYDDMIQYDCNDGTGEKCIDLDFYMERGISSYLKYGLNSVAFGIYDAAGNITYWGLDDDGNELLNVMLPTTGQTKKGGRVDGGIEFDHLMDFCTTMPAMPAVVDAEFGHAMADHSQRVCHDTDSGNDGYFGITATTEDTENVRLDPGSPSPESPLGQFYYRFVGSYSDDFKILSYMDPDFFNDGNESPIFGDADFSTVDVHVDEDGNFETWVPIMPHLVGGTEGMRISFKDATGTSYIFHDFQLSFVTRPEIAFDNEQNNFESIESIHETDPDLDFYRAGGNSKIVSGSILRGYDGDEITLHGTVDASAGAVWVATDSQIVDVFGLQIESNMKQILYYPGDPSREITNDPNAGFWTAANLEEFQSFCGVDESDSKIHKNQDSLNPANWEWYCIIYPDTMRVLPNSQAIFENPVYDSIGLTSRNDNWNDNKNFTTNPLPLHAGINTLTIKIATLNPNYDPTLVTANMDPAYAKYLTSYSTIDYYIENTGDEYHGNDTNEYYPVVFYNANAMIYEGNEFWSDYNPATEIYTLHGAASNDVKDLRISGIVPNSDDPSSKVNNINPATRGFDHDIKVPQHSTNVIRYDYQLFSEWNIWHTDYIIVSLGQPFPEVTYNQLGFTQSYRDNGDLDVWTNTDSDLTISGQVYDHHGDAMFMINDEGMYTGLGTRFTGIYTGNKTVVTPFSKDFSIARSDDVNADPSEKEIYGDEAGAHNDDTKFTTDLLYLDAQDFHENHIYVHHRKHAVDTPSVASSGDGTFAVDFGNGEYKGEYVFWREVANSASSNALSVQSADTSAPGTTTTPSPQLATLGVGAPVNGVNAFDFTGWTAVPASSVDIPDGVKAEIVAVDAFGNVSDSVSVTGYSVDNPWGPIGSTGVTVGLLLLIILFLLGGGLLIIRTRKHH